MPGFIVELRGRSIPVREPDACETDWYGGQANHLSKERTAYTRIDGIHGATKLSKRTCRGICPAELAPTGKLRAGMNLGNALFTTKDVATGELRGVSVDVMRELASRLGVRVDFVEIFPVGNVGFRFLKDLVVTFDPANHRVRFVRP